MKFKGLKLNSTESILSKRGFGKDKETQKFLDKEVIKASEKYIPLDSGELIESSNATKLGSGNIEYDADYAREVYYTQKNYGGSPQRGAYWFERMKTDNLDELLKKAAKKSGGEGTK